jgi:hypothetical protein
VSYFTLRASLILRGTIKDLYKRLIMKAVAAPVGAPWMWTLAPTHGYAETREAAMAAFAKLAAGVVQWKPRLRSKQPASCPP